VHGLPGHVAWVRAVAVSADGRRAVSGGTDGAVRVWDVATGKQIVSTSQRPKFWPLRRSFALPCTAIHFPSARTAAAPSPATRTGRCGCVGPGGRETRARPARARRFVGGSGGQRGRPPRRLHGGYDGAVRMWDLTQGAELASFVSGNSIAVIAPTPAGVRASAAVLARLRAQEDGAAAVAAGKGRSGGTSPPRRRGRAAEERHARGVAETRPQPSLVRPAPGNPAQLPRPSHVARRGEE
jgi:hypothetical protein